MSRKVTEFLGDETSVSVWWYSNGRLLDFSLATFEGKMYRADDVTKTVLFTKQSGFTGALGSDPPKTGTPNLLIEWALNGDLSTAGMSGGLHIFQVTATAPNGGQRTHDFSFDLFARV